MADDTGASPPEKRPNRILIKPLSIVLGIVSGLGFAVMLQQYAVTPLTIPLLVGMAILGALVFGIGLPTLMLNIYLMRAKSKEAHQ